MHGLHLLQIARHWWNLHVAFTVIDSVCKLPFFWSSSLSSQSSLLLLPSVHCSLFIITLLFPLPNPCHFPRCIVTPQPLPCHVHASAMLLHFVLKLKFVVIPYIISNYWCCHLIFLITPLNILAYFFNDDNRDSHADVYISLQNIWANKPNSRLHIHLLEEIFLRSGREVSWSVSSLGRGWSGGQMLVCKRRLTFSFHDIIFFNVGARIHVFMIYFQRPHDGRHSW